jgi:hypothetical protein
VDGRRLQHHETGALREQCRAAKDRNKTEADPLHRLDPPSRQSETDELCQAADYRDGDSSKKAA